jgi:hypothetical protein
LGRHNVPISFFEIWCEIEDLTPFIDIQIQFRLCKVLINVRVAEVIGCEENVGHFLQSRVALGVDEGLYAKEVINVLRNSFELEHRN